MSLTHVTSICVDCLRSSVSPMSQTQINVSGRVTSYGNSVN